MEKLNRDSIIGDVFNGISSNQFIACLIWAMLGIIASFLIEVMRHNKVIKANGGFSIKVWLSDNLTRAGLSVIVVICGIIFAPDLLNTDQGIKGAFLSGLVTDKSIETLIKLKETINIGALWKKKS
jgi:hypothetical protein